MLLPHQPAVNASSGWLPDMRVQRLAALALARAARFARIGSR